MGAPLIIIGAGQAAAQAIASLRTEGYGGPIILLGDEPWLPYQRPPLSKAYLGGEMEEERLALRAPGFYTQHGVEVHVGVRVVRILPQQREVELTGGVRLSYGALLLATGTRARPLDVPGAKLAGVHSIRTIDDVKRFRAECHPGGRLVIIGGGYIGLEVAAKARRMGLEVCVLEGRERLLARVACPDVSAFVSGLHRAHGVSLRTAMSVVRLVGEERVRGVEVAGGEILEADIVLSAVGALPNMELAQAAGLELDNGVKVDAATRTSVADIYAVGDVASFPSARYGRRVRLESVQNAIDQAKAAAQAITGQEVVYDPVPWFWSDQYDVKIQIAGLLDGYESTRIEGDREAGRFSVHYYAAERLLAVCSINDPRSHMLARRALAG
ncbi:NAD(P)/FAD-dependent oxidoreductase [Xanthobacter sp. TB0136]|uniref:NAD(P)/FAD-dependent oxidoreductase n=1 Tax=Xanthobacter sp. TB0136 TaxID=3459177 RepID=UPI004039B37A